MLTFLLIPDTNQFLKLVHKSRGEVLLRMPDGIRRDLKHSSDARQILETVQSAKAGVEISFSDHNDMKPFIRYMMEAAFIS